MISITRSPGSGVSRPELTSIDEEVEKMRMRFEAAVHDPANQRLELLAPRPRHECDRRSFERRVADLHDLLVGEVGNEPDALRRTFLEMPPESARQIEHRHVLEWNPILAENDLQSGDVGTFRLSQLVDVLLEKIDVAVRVHCHSLDVVLESPHRIHATRSKQFTQQV